MGTDFDKAKAAFISGDPRKIAEYVRANPLTEDQAEFVAMALAGEVKVQDGRSEKPWTLNLYLDYIEIKIGGELRELLFGKKQRISKAEIFRKLADLHGYHEDAVRKAITRASQRRNGRYHLPDVFARAQNQGRRMMMRMNWNKTIEASVKQRLEVLTSSTTERTLGGRFTCNPVSKENLDVRIDAFISSFNKNRDTIKK